MNRYQINEGEKYLNEREIKVVEEEENDDNIASFPVQCSISKTAEKEGRFRLYGKCLYSIVR